MRVTIVELFKIIYNMDKNHEVYRHKHIVFAQDHYNPLGIIRSLGEEGIKPIVVLCCDKPHFLHKSKYIGTLHLCNDLEAGLELIISKYGNEKLKPFIYNGGEDPGILLDNRYEELKDKFYFFNGQGTIAKSMQKYENCLMASQCGISVPKEEYLERGVLPTTLKYPIMTKASTSACGGNWKGDSFICNTPDELTEAYKKIKSEHVLVQEFIVKENELCLDGISINGGENIYIPYGCSYYRFTPESYGNYMYFYPFIDAELLQKIHKLIKMSRYTGVFCIEFLKGKDGGCYFLEVNYRNSGWSYAFTVGGFNLPFRWAVSVLDNKLYTSDFTHKKSFSAMNDFSDLKDVVKTKSTSIFAWIKQYITTDCHYYYNGKDSKPFWFCLLHKFHLA